jgi:hypothetical protein
LLLNPNILFSTQFPNSILLATHEVLPSCTEHCPVVHINFDSVGRKTWRWDALNLNGSTYILYVFYNILFPGQQNEAVKQYYFKLIFWRCLVQISAKTAVVLTEVLCNFRQSLQESCLGCNSLFPNYFWFIVYQPF